MSSDRRSATSYEVTVGGTTFKQKSDGSQGVESITVEDHIDMVDMITIRLGGAEGQPAWGFTIGDEVQAKVGEGSVKLFVGQVTALEPEFRVGGIASIVVRGLDPVHKLGRGRKTRFWEEMKDSDVATEVGQECGLSVSADATDEVMSYILQRNESNVAFLKRLAARNNFYLRVDEGTLMFKKNTYSGSAITLKLGESLRSLKMNFNSVDQVQKVVVRGWDITKKEEIEGSEASCTKIGGGQAGYEAAGQFGESIAYITDVPVSSQGQAKAIATAEFERLARQFVRGTGVTQGNEKLRAGSVVQLDGLSSPYNGKYFVIASRHIISNRTGYTTEFTFCSNTFGS